MALKLDYVVRETSTNMRRNVTLTIAAIVTMAVSLGLFGSAMLIRAGVDSLSSRWQKGVEVIVFVDRKITPEQTDALEKKLGALIAKHGPQKGAILDLRNNPGGLLDQGILCMGPATRSGCGGLCPKANVPCRGCYGPAPNVTDQGAKMVSAISSVIDSQDPDEINRILDQIPDPVGTFYRFSIPESMLHRKQSDSAAR